MTSDAAPRTVLVDQELLRNLTRDATLYTLTRPLAVIAYASLIAALIVNVIVLVLIGDAEHERSATLSWTPFAIAALIAASIIFTRSSVQRAIGSAMPAGTKIGIQLDDKMIRMMSKRGVSEMSYETFRSVRVGKHAVILQLRGQSVVTAIPRALLDDADIAQLKSQI
ncbi:YcxB family protein [Microbacterium sp. A82]|uniref:YcxB family protein n=1 Tax=unclassified Microbacterium TaxID=2609290 RepID=UPI003F2CF240